MPNLQDRFHALPSSQLQDQLKLRTGTLGDYGQLACHHYRGGKPATATRVLVLEHDRPTPVLSREPSECRRAGSVAAVLIESLAALSCTLRDHAFNHRYGAWLGPRQRAAMLNSEMRCISRVVVSPPWRGLGLAMRLVTHALSTAQTPFTEALAVMGKVNPFFERAGMSPYHRPPHRADARLTAGLHTAGIQPADLVRVDRLSQRIEALDEPHHSLVLRELKRWHSQRGCRKRSGKTKPSDETVKTYLRAAQDHLLFHPVYFLHDNRRGLHDAINSTPSPASPSPQRQRDARAASQATHRAYSANGAISADYRSA